MIDEHGLPDHDGLWADNDNQPWLVVTIPTPDGDQLWLRRLDSRTPIVGRGGWIVDLDVDGFAPFVPVDVVLCDAMPEDDLYVPGVYTDANGTLWLLERMDDALKPIRRDGEWLWDGGDEPKPRPCGPFTLMDMIPRKTDRPAASDPFARLPHDAIIPHDCVWCGGHTARHRLHAPVLNRHYPFDLRTGDITHDTTVDAIVDMDVWVCDQCIVRLVRLETDWSRIRISGLRWSRGLIRESARNIRPMKGEDTE